jgi:hypothetical protein
VVGGSTRRITGGEAAPQSLPEGVTAGRRQASEREPEPARPVGAADRLIPCLERDRVPQWRERGAVGRVKDPALEVSDQLLENSVAEADVEAINAVLLDPFLDVSRRKPRRVVLDLDTRAPRPARRGEPPSPRPPPPPRGVPDQRAGAWGSAMTG